MAQLITSVDQLDFTVDDIPSMPLPRKVLLVRPTYFSVDYVINPYMAENLGQVDQMEARNQWEVIKDIYGELGLQVHVLDGVEGLPDMVFCSNQSLPYQDPKRQRKVVMSIMRSEHRSGEVPYVEQWYRRNGYEIHYLDEESVTSFEGCGDAVWHDGRRLLWAGHGFRSTPQAHEKVSELLDLPVISLELVDESFYHLDTCLCVLNKTTALAYPGAFTGEGMELLETLFENLIVATKYEARELFACNATCPDGSNVVIQKGCTDVTKKLRDAGFLVHEVDTSEFLKAGGSVYCMKQLIW